MKRAYPNPANAFTTLRFNAPQGGYGTLTVMNALGQQVAIVYAGELSAGEHTRTWNVPAGLVPGIYYARIVCGEQSQTVKVAKE